MFALNDIFNIIERWQMLRLLDGVDLEIIAMLQQNGRMPNTEIARRLGVLDIFMLVQKYLTKGLFAGAVKG